MIHLYPDFQCPECDFEPVDLKPGFLVLKIEYSGPMSASWATGTPEQSLTKSFIILQNTLYTGGLEGSRPMTVL